MRRWNGGLLRIKAVHEASGLTVGLTPGNIRLHLQAPPPSSFRPLQETTLARLLLPTFKSINHHYGRLRRLTARSYSKSYRIGLKFPHSLLCKAVS